MIKLGINGFGRIGRVILRACLQKPDFEITAINDPAIDVQYICYLIKFDSTHGKFIGSVKHTKDEILVNDKKIKIFHENVPANIPWHTAGVHYVIEASGMFTTMEKASGHLASETVKRVILTAPSIDIPMLVLGVNDNTLRPGHRVISCTSSTLYCLAPIIKVLDDSFGLGEGFVTSIHAMTPSLKPLDGLCLRGKHWRDHRSISQNIIPAMTGACKVLGKIMPSVKDKLCGLAFRVPIVNVSVLDISIRLKSSTTLQEIFKEVEKAGNAELKNLIRISREFAVSSDFIGETYSCILDADSSLQLKPNFFKLVCWYENEYSYAYRVIDTITFCENRSFTANVLTLVRKKDSTQQTDGSRKIFLSRTTPETSFKHKIHSKQLVLKKPIPSQFSSSTKSVKNKDCKKRNDFLNIWNDEIETLTPSVRQNRNCFFHSCIVISPRNFEQISAVKAHDRLEMLKKEFSKMVNVTESLLKKSYNVGKFSVKSDNKAINDASEKVLEVGILENRKELSDESNKAQSNRMFGDCKSSFSPLLEKSFITEDSDCRNLDKKENIKKSDLEMEHTQSSLTEIAILTESNINKENNTISLDQENTPKLPSKANEANQIEHKCYPVNEINITNLEECDHETITPINTNTIKYANVKEKNSNQIPKYGLRELNNVSNISNSESKPVMPKIQDLDKSKYEKSRPLSQLFACMKLNSTGNTVQNIKLDADSIVKNSPTVGDEGSNKSLENANKSSIECNSLLANASNNSAEHSITSEPTSTCGTPDNNSVTMSNVEMIKNTEDIYDKLDSISGTDSNNSFQIHERKSQVIDIKDLTTSLDDLAQLDKICKIMEISDELSDKLFSPLDSNDGTQTKNKKWTLKDLCERIKLDEFCDSVFGSPSCSGIS